MAVSTTPPLVVHKLRPTVAFLVRGGELANNNNSLHTFPAHTSPLHIFLLPLLHTFPAIHIPPYALSAIPLQNFHVMLQIHAGCIHVTTGNVTYYNASTTSDRLLSLTST